MAIVGYQGSKVGPDDWLTPPLIINSLGDFDLDPCAAVARPWDTAAVHFTENEDGLKRRWCGRVWCHPPYGKEAGSWLKRLADHGNGIALIRARTETNIFFSQVWVKATAILFLQGRMHFHNRNGVRLTQNAGGPSVLVAYGLRNAESLEESGLAGKLIWLVD